MTVVGILFVSAAIQQLLLLPVFTVFFIYCTSAIVDRNIIHEITNSFSHLQPVTAIAENSRHV
jgi:hypothetical protein